MDVSFSLTQSSSSFLFSPAQLLNLGSYYFPRSFHRTFFVLCATLLCSAWANTEWAAKPCSFEASWTLRCHVSTQYLNFYIRSELVLSRLPDSWISGASKTLGADIVFAWVCEAGGVRGICSYLIFFLTLSHSLCGFGKFACSRGSVSLTPEQKQALSAQQAAAPAHGYTWKQHVNHCTVVQRNFFPSISVSTEYRKFLMV